MCFVKGSTSKLVVDSLSRQSMPLAFNEYANLVEITVANKLVTALKRFDAIVASFYGSISPVAAMVVHDLFFPIGVKSCRLFDNYLLLRTDLCFMKATTPSMLASSCSYYPPAEWRNSNSIFPVSSTA